MQVTANVKRNLTCSAGVVRTLQVLPHSILEVEEKLGHATNTEVLKSEPFFPHGRDDKLPTMLGTLECAGVH